MESRAFAGNAPYLSQSQRATMNHTSGPRSPAQPDPNQPSLPAVVGENEAGERWLLDPGPRLELEPEHTPPADTRTLPLRWRPQGHAPGAAWRRAGVEGGRPELEAHALMAAVAAVDTHAGHGRRNGRPWKRCDGHTLRELEARSWGVAELSSLSFVKLSRMLEPYLVRRGRDGREWSCARYGPFLGALLMAYEHGAMAVILSLEEIASEFGVSRRTAVRWIADMQAQGWIVVLPTWFAIDGDRTRKRRRNAYQIGPTPEAELGPALLERASAVTRGGLRPRRPGPGPRHRRPSPTRAPVRPLARRLPRGCNRGASRPRRPELQAGRSA